MKIYLKLLAYRKLKSLITNCDTEIMGLGKVTATNKEIVIIEDVEIMKQEVTSASAEFDKDKLMEFVHSRVAKGDASDWRLWWHSHADMDTFWSATDTDNIDNMGDTAEWMVSIVFNKEMKNLGRVDVFKPLKVSQDNIKIEILIPGVEGVDEWAKKEIKDKLTIPAPTKRESSKTMSPLKEAYEQKAWDVSCKVYNDEVLSPDERKFYKDNFEYIEEMNAPFYGRGGAE